MNLVLLFVVKPPTQFQSSQSLAPSSRPLLVAITKYIQRFQSTRVYTQTYISYQITTRLSVHACTHGYTYMYIHTHSHVSRWLFKVDVNLPANAFYVYFTHLVTCRFPCLGSGRVLSYTKWIWMNIWWWAHVTLCIYILLKLLWRHIIRKIRLHVVHCIYMAAHTSKLLVVHVYSVSQHGTIALAVPIFIWG